MKSKALQGVCVFDPDVATSLKDMIPGKAVPVIPDIPNVEVRESGLSKRIGELARGRKIIILSGYLGKSKGVLEFVRAATRLKEEELFFVLIGNLSFGDFTDAEQAEISTWGQETENAFFFPSRIESEEALNGILKVANVTCAVYQAWPFSSNAIAKAAYFENHILVAKGRFMERRVKELEIGVSVEEKDINAIAEKIVHLAGQPIDSEKYEKARRILSKEEFTRAVGL
ncbi:MAG: glycosyltransferase, partial [Verrucomicrobiota bacterium]